MSAMISGWDVWQVSTDSGFRWETNLCGTSTKTVQDLSWSVNDDDWRERHTQAPMKLP